MAWLRRLMPKSPNWPTRGIKMASSFVRDVSLSAVVAGLIAATIGFSASGVIVFQAAVAGHLSPAQTASWLMAIAGGAGILGVGYSLLYRAPVITAWSTGGAALLITSLPTMPYNEAIAAYGAAGVMVAVLGVTGLFSKIMQHVPTAVVSAMLAGILFRFGVGLFTSFETAPWIVGSVLALYIMGRRWQPRYAVVLALATGVTVAARQGVIMLPTTPWTLTVPHWTTPHFTLASFISLAIPLAFVIMASQNAPGAGIMRVAGYGSVPVTPVITASGIVSALTAPFGGHGVCLAAITTAICTGPDCHPDKDRRYVAGVVCGLYYLIAGAFGSAVVSVFSGLPKALIAAVAGVALLAALGNGLAGAVSDEKQRDGGLIAFLVTASGVTLLGVGAAFWGLLAGVVVDGVVRGWRRGESHP